MFTLELKDLPFEQMEEQIIYTEGEYNEEVNRYILQNYDNIKRRFKERGKEFLYMPKLMEELRAQDVVRYNAPYAERLNEDVTIGNDFLLQFMVHPEDKKKVQPSLLYFYTETNKYVSQYKGFELTPKSGYKDTNDLSNILAEIIADGSEQISFSLDKDTFWEKAFKGLTDFSKKIVEAEYDESETFEESASVNRCIIPKKEKEEEEFDSETLQMIEDARTIYEKLVQRGIPEYILQKKIIYGEEKLSRLFVSKDYHIFLTDYNNEEVVMRPMPKMLFFLYLRHPEGIRFKSLIDYKDEMLEIYKAVKQGFYNLDEAKNSISILCDPLKNSASEKTFHIKAAFEKTIKTRLAKEYCINGPQGGTKTIALPRDMVTWEKPILF